MALRMLTHILELWTTCKCWKRRTRIKNEKWLQQNLKMSEVCRAKGYQTTTNWKFINTTDTTQFTAHIWWCVQFSHVYIVCANPYIRSSLQRGGVQNVCTISIGLIYYLFIGHMSYSLIFMHKMHYPGLLKSTESPSASLCYICSNDFAVFYLCISMVWYYSTLWVFH